MHIDALQYGNWSRKIFEQMRTGGVDCVHVTLAYHENFRETVQRMEAWNQRFTDHADLISHAHTTDDIRAAKAAGKTAIIYGAQTPAPIEDDIRLLEILHRLGLRIMQLTYNNQSLLATGCYEDNDSGLTRMGREVVAEMNRLGIVVDMSHSADRSTREAIDRSTQPIAITHANPDWWHPARRNKPDAVLTALTGRGGMLGFSLYPHHLKDGGACTLDSFCQMIAEAATRYGAQNLGVGSDLCQDQPDSVVEWMRVGRWTRKIDFGEGSASTPGFPPQPAFFHDNHDFAGLADGLATAGFDKSEIAGIMGGNWLRFFDRVFAGNG
jgi:microsomal dipeptidase-like Zn-dependent dipeptidase